MTNKQWASTKNNYPSNWETELVPNTLKRDRFICQLQDGPDCTIEATEVDHRIPISRGGTHGYSNLQAVCQTCHKKKTQQEADDGITVSNPREYPSAGYLDQIDQANFEHNLQYAKPKSEWFEAHGPMWEKDAFGAYRLPLYTIGWQVLAWIMKHLQIRDAPMVPTGEQARFILWSYAVDKNGDWLYEELMKIAPKGHGKDPTLAMIASVEFIGPCRFAGWQTNPDGTRTPMARDEPGAYYQIAAGNYDQADITFRYLREIFTPQTRQKYGIEIPKGPIIYALNRNRQIEKLASTASSKEGQTISGAGMSELEHWTKSKGLDKLYNTIRRNVDKKPGARTWVITNAWNPSENSQAQVLFEEYMQWKNGRIKDPKRMVDAYMATNHAPYKRWEDRIYVLRRVYGESVRFVDLAKIARKFDSISAPIAETLAFFYNCVSIGANVWVDIRNWDACRDWRLKPDQDLPRGTRIVLAGDMSLNDDSTALVGIVWGGPYDLTVIPFGIWKPERGKQIDREAIDKKVEWIFSYYSVQAFWVDPSHKKDESDIQFWGPYVDEWHQKYRGRITQRLWATRDNAVKFDMASSSNNRLFVEALDKVEALITDRKIKHNGDEILREHVQNARRVKKKGYDEQTIGKEGPQSPLKIDAAVCMVIAYLLYTKLSNYKKPPTEGILNNGSTEIHTAAQEPEKPAGLLQHQ